MAEKLPAELLAAVLAEGLVLPLEAVLAAGTNRKRGVPALKKGRFAIVDHRHGDAVGELLTGRENAQQFVGRSVQADADLLQRVDRGSGLAAGDGAEISGAEESCWLSQMRRMESESFLENMSSSRLLYEILQLA